MILLGLVGTPACGKSTVAKHLQKLGAEWINADLIARDVLNQPNVVAQLREHFGPDVVREGGEVDRKAVAFLVFGDTPEKKAALDFLESVIHPPTRLEITKRLQAFAKRSVQVAILDIPLLFESKWDRSCDVIWCVDAPIESRVQWSSGRGWDAQELSRRENNQLPIEEKKRLSNVFLWNDATLPILAENVDSLYRDLVTMEASGAGSSKSNHCLMDS